MTPPQKKMKIEIQERRGDPETPPPPSFTIDRSVPKNHFVLEVIQSGGFKQSNAAREITYRAKFKKSLR